MAMKCGTCRLVVEEIVVKAEVTGRSGYGDSVVTTWMQCPACREGSVRTRDGSTHPVAPAFSDVAALPTDVATAWREARLAHSVGAYTASDIMCRKILMHLAVDATASPPGKSFVSYVDDLVLEGYVTKGLRPVVDLVRQRGNAANHELPASTDRECLVTLQVTEHLLRSAYELPSLVPGVVETGTVT